MIAAVPSGIAMVGVGAAVPGRILTNDELSRRIDTSDEWIASRSGIRERRVLVEGESAVDLGLAAAEQALDRSGLAPAEIDLVIVATASPERHFPAGAVLVADRLGAHGAAAYDLLAACTGFVYGLGQAIGQIQAGLAEHALVIGAEGMSRILDWDDRTTCVLFGDGAGAVVLSADALPPELVGVELGADGARATDLYANVGPGEHLRMNGREVFRFATRTMVDSTQRLLDRCALGVDDVDWFVPHQANRRIIDHAVPRLGVDPGRVLVNLERFGNTSSASIPLCLEEAWTAGRLERGQRIVMVGFGGGLTWGSCVLRWAGRPPGGG